MATEASPLTAHAPLRIARPTADLHRAEDFWHRGVGLQVLWRSDPDDEVAGTHQLLMLGLPGAGWHLELVADADAAAANPPGPEDLLVLYLGAPVDPVLLERISAHGGRVVDSPNPYWNRWGVSIADPDGYRLVLSERNWEM